MSREKKKGTSGNAKAFITRAKALKKLQLSLSEFRRLCILKGIYPRDPRKKLEGSDKTYYLRKDIDFLRHERLIGTIRQENAHKKKEVKARAKRRIDILKRLVLSKPKSRLDHLVVERYPDFTDAIRELDDPLCIVALFANLPADHKVGIAPKRVSNCQRLLKEFHNFVAETKALKRCFVSIKGYYFQARVAGELVTWVLPHRFSQILPADVDYSVMLTFLELYECILSFVNFRLYTSQNLAYPPKISRVADSKGLELASVEVEKIHKPLEGGENGWVEKDPKISDSVKVSAQAVEKAQRMLMTAQGGEDEEDEGDEDDEETEERNGDDAVGRSTESITNKDEIDCKDGGDDDAETPPVGVFAGKSLILGREVPYVELEFALKASGALQVTREDNLAGGPDRLSGYTHWVIDRPKVVGQRDMSLEYIQPQYIFDSINAGVPLPTSLYAPGVHLPPHLSPFVTDEDDGGYRPWFRDVLDRIKAGDTSVVAEAAAVVYAEGAANAKKDSEKAVEAKKTAAERGDKPNGTRVRSPETRKPGKVADQTTDAQREDMVNDEINGAAPGSMDHESDCDSEEPDQNGTVGIERRRNLEDSDRESDGTSESHESEEEDEEDEEERIAKGTEVKMSEEGKEMAALMMSRKKMRQYRKHIREVEAKSKIKDRLTAKRKQLEGETGANLPNKSKKKQRKVE